MKMLLMVTTAAVFFLVFAVRTVIVTIAMPVNIDTHSTVATAELLVVGTGCVREWWRKDSLDERRELTRTLTTVVLVTPVSTIVASVTTHTSANAVPLCAAELSCVAP